jgi:hypothetical protein
MTKVGNLPFGRYYVFWAKHFLSGITCLSTWTLGNIVHLIAFDLSFDLYLHNSIIVYTPWTLY